jgi:hypothetical protein
MDPAGFYTYIRAGAQIGERVVGIYCECLVIVFPHKLRIKSENPTYFDNYGSKAAWIRIRNEIFGKCESASDKCGSKTLLLT